MGETKLDARAMFQRGDKVRLTALGIANGLDGFANVRSKSRSLQGRVVGYGRRDERGYVLIRVLRDGYSSPRTYHVNYWTKARHAASSVSGEG